MSRWRAVYAGFIAGFVLVAPYANAAVRDSIRIKVLDSETHSTTIDDSGVPKNCDQVNFDAYCHNSKSVLLTNTLTVQEDNHPPFRVNCTIDSKWSRCTPLPKGESFDAKKEKRGILIYYVDDKGKARSQLYTLAPGETKAYDLATAAPPAPAPHPATTPAANSPSVAPVAPSSSALPQLPQKNSSEKVRCRFVSTPTGAEISIDDKYLGNTPSEIDLSVGAHVVVFSMQGFTQWKRELTVMSGSELTVSAILQKQ
ncbi:MAG TPA: PEGA domain-containing protein [Candidatus Dormibacteraeota bacterium]|jgi:hypothetical protein|nr:PEGA domain-containing protein [Candidatus Dormibacteraeota bacterium]